MNSGYCEGTEHRSGCTVKKFLGKTEQFRLTIITFIISLHSIHSLNALNFQGFLN